MLPTPSVSRETRIFSVIQTYFLASILYHSTLYRPIKINNLMNGVNIPNYAFIYKKNCETHYRGEEFLFLK